jgi:hypothetical protein
VRCFGGCAAVAVALRVCGGKRRVSSSMSQDAVVRGWKLAL